MRTTIRYRIHYRGLEVVGTQGRRKRRRTEIEHHLAPEPSYRGVSRQLR